MELIDRYIYEVGRHLPRKNRGDIQAELRSLLLDSLDTSEEGNLSEEEVVTLLKEFGPPEKVAASYGSQNQYLIGPPLYPFFRLVVGIVLIALIGAQLLALGVGVIFSQEPLIFPEPLTVLADMFGSLLSAFGMIVLVFMVLQRFGVRPETEKEDWDPRTLPIIDETETVSRRGTLIGIAFSMVILAILWFFPDKIGFVVTLGEDIIANPVIAGYILLISVALLLSIALDLVLLRQGRWQTGTHIAKIGVNLLSIYVLFQLIAGHSAWLAQQSAGGFFSSLEALSAGVRPQTELVQIIGMQAFWMAFVIALIVITIETVIMSYRLIKRSIFPTQPIAPADEPRHSG